MNARRTLTVAILLVSAALVTCSAVGLESGDFRVETDVFVDDTKDPVSETLTLFSGDLVYDFLLSEPEEITILDVRRSRIVLLDKARRIKTTLTTDELRQFTAALKFLASDTENKEVFEPQFVQQFDKASGELVLSGVMITYRVLGIEPKHPGVSRKYREFADWYARLNAARFRNLPPFARIELNRSLAEKGLLPKEVSRTVVTPQPLIDKKTTAHSRHTFVWSLSNSDRKRIENVGTYQASYKTVSFPEYWGVERVAARAK